MGLDASYPAVRINDPAATVPVWNGNRMIIGHLGPDDNYHSAAANITCTLPRLNGLWYKLLNSTDWDIPATSAYVSATLTHLMYPGPPGYVLSNCPNNRDRPGRLPWWLCLLVALVLWPWFAGSAAGFDEPGLADGAICPSGTCPAWPKAFPAAARCCSKSESWRRPCWVHGAACNPRRVRYCAAAMAEEKLSEEERRELPLRPGRLACASSIGLSVKAGGTTECVPFQGSSTRLRRAVLRCGARSWPGSYIVPGALISMQRVPCDRHPGLLDSRVEGSWRRNRANQSLPAAVWSGSSCLAAIRRCCLVKLTTNDRSARISGPSTCRTRDGRESGEEHGMRSRGSSSPDHGWLFGRGLGFDHFHHPWERVDDDQDSDGDADDVVRTPGSARSRCRS